MVSTSSFRTDAEDTEFGQWLQCLKNRTLEPKWPRTSPGRIIYPLLKWQVSLQKDCLFLPSTFYLPLYRYVSPAPDLKAAAGRYLDSGDPTLLAGWSFAICLKQKKLSSTKMVSILTSTKMVSKGNLPSSRRLLARKASLLRRTGNASLKPLPMSMPLIFDKSASKRESSVKVESLSQDLGCRRSSVLMAPSTWDTWLNNLWTKIFQNCSQSCVWIHQLQQCWGEREADLAALVFGCNASLFSVGSSDSWSNSLCSPFSVFHTFYLKLLVSIAT